MWLFLTVVPDLDWRELKVRANNLESFENPPATMSFEGSLINHDEMIQVEKTRNSGWKKKLMAVIVDQHADESIHVVCDDSLISDVFVTMSHRALPVGILLDVPIHIRSIISSTHCQTLPTQVSPPICAISEILWKTFSCEGALPSMTMKANIPGLPTTFHKIYLMESSISLPRFFFCSSLPREESVW